MIFIGQNNHGKSNILYGLMFFFGQVPFEDLDFNETSNELFVEVTFEDLDESDQITFNKYTTASNTMCVRKEAVKGTGTGTPRGRLGRGTHNRRSGGCSGD